MIHSRSVSGTREEGFGTLNNKKEVERWACGLQHHAVQGKWLQCGKNIHWEQAARTYSMQQSLLFPQDLREPHIQHKTKGTPCHCIYSTAPSTNYQDA